MIKKVMLIFLLIFLLGCKTECNVDKFPVYGENNEFYELCIPNSEEQINEVKEIVPEAFFFEDEEGIIGCDTNNEILIELELDVSEDILCKLSNLEYVQTISGAYID